MRIKPPQLSGLKRGPPLSQTAGSSNASACLQILGRRIAQQGLLETICSAHLLATGRFDKYSEGAKLDKLPDAEAEGNTQRQVALTRHSIGRVAGASDPRELTSVHNVKCQKPVCGVAPL